MSEKKPDTPVVHLPWSHWEALTARLDALEAAVFRAKRQPEESPSDRAIRGVKDGFAQRLTEAAPPPPPPAAAPAPDVIERVRVALDDARAQIEYLHEKFQSTGSGNASIARITEALRLLGDAP